MADVANMQVESKRRSASRRGIAERRTVFRIERTRVDLLPGPYVGSRHEVGEVARVDQRSPNVSIAVARKRAKVRLVRVDVLDDSGEAMMLQLLRDLSRVGLGCQTILVDQDDAARVVTKADPIRT